MLENGSVRDDLTLPSGTEEAERVAKQLKEEFANGAEVIVTVLKVRAAAHAWCAEKHARGACCRSWRCLHAHGRAGRVCMARRAKPAITAA